ncbi:MAG: PASTA domain-containing protein [Oscillospiraceae bacterium]|nr:PASTA domain-containing protein [Oscillospiraceae bacterium]
MSDRKLCMCCMSPVPSGALACPSCGYNGSQQNPEGLLPIGSRIGKGKYLIGRAEEIHTECVDYIAFDVSGYRKCTVREFLPAGGIIRVKGEMAMQPLTGAEKRFRSGLNRFVSAYGSMRELPDECAVPKVHDLIQQNGTAYAVIDKFSGMTLRELLRRNGGTLSVAQTQIVMEPVMDALEAVHSKGLFHGNISPDNILIDNNGDVRLDEFSVGDTPSTQKAVGFCSPECESGEKAQAISDVYSLGAVFYRCVLGVAPQDGVQRKNFDTLTTMAEMSEDVPEEVSAAVWNAMLVNKANRTASVKALRRALNGEPPEEETGSVVSQLFFSSEEETAKTEEEKKRRNRWRYLSLISLCLLFVMTAVYFVSVEAAKKERERRRAEEQENLPESLTVEAPDYRGKKLADTDLDTLSFDFVVITTHTEGTEEDVIVNQDPYPGTEMEPDHRTITLFVNRIKETAVMPDLSGLYLPNAEQLLEAYGIKYEVVFEEAEDKFPGLVYEQSVERGTEIDLSETVTIKVQPDPFDPDMDGVPDTEEETEESEETG